MGKIFVGTYVPAGKVQMEMLADKKIGGAKGHVITSVKLADNNHFTYYFGSGWDRNPSTSFRDINLWAQYLNTFASQQRVPLMIRIK